MRLPISGLQGTHSQKPLCTLEVAVSKHCAGHPVPPTLKPNQTKPKRADLQPALPYQNPRRTSYAGILVLVI